MDRIWAPWRTAYLQNATEKTDACLFCVIGKDGNGRQDHVFLRRTHCYAVLNRYPYNNGHVLIVPYRHINDLSLLTREEVLDCFETLSYVQSLLTEMLHPEGFNVGINIGRAAGAGIPDHIHLHIVPRWVGDVNFMPVLSDTRVISQSLDELHQALVSAHQKRSAP